MVVLDPSTLVVKENAATLFDYEAPEMLCGKVCF